MAGPDREPDGLLPTLWRSGAIRIFPILFLYVAGEISMTEYHVGRSAVLMTSPGTPKFSSGRGAAAMVERSERFAQLKH